MKECNNFMKLSSIHKVLETWYTYDTFLDYTDLVTFIIPS